MAGYQCLEKLIFLQSQKLQDLEITTDLIQNKNTIHEELVDAYEDVSFIGNGIQQLKKDLKLMRQDNEFCKELSTLLKSLDHQIQHMQNNIPLKIQEYVNSELPKSISNQCTTGGNLNNTLNNIALLSDDNRTNVQIFNDMKNCKKILFNDPEIPSMRTIAEDEYSRIPKYIIGRYSLEILNNLIITINQIIKAKYSVIALGKNGARKKSELDLYLYYKKEQISIGVDEANTYFFTSNDYEKYMKAKLDKTKLNLLIALRHCKRLREIRTAKTVHYAMIIS